MNQQIHPDQDAERIQECPVMAEGDGGKRMRRRPIELRASDGFGSLEPSPMTALSWASVLGICNGGEFWRRSAKSDRG